LKVHEKPDGRVELLTKGDNNRVDDRWVVVVGCVSDVRFVCIHRTCIFSRLNPL
jgi:hypothetical protein